MNLGRYGVATRISSMQAKHIWERVRFGAEWFVGGGEYGMVWCLGLRAEFE